jgi:hypothetical protein
MGTDLRSANADAEGRFEVGLDAPGHYFVDVLGGGLGAMRGAVTAEIDVPDEPEVARDVVLSALSISGRVSDTAGNPIARANVVAEGEAGGTDGRPRRPSANTAPDGSYTIEGVEPGRYQVTASANGYRTEKAGPIEVAEGAAAPRVDLTLAKGRLLRGRVIDPEGRGVPDTMVFVVAGGETRPSQPVQTDVNGTFETTAPSEGSVDVVALPPGWAPARLAGIVPPVDEDAPPIEVRVSAGGKLRVMLVGGEPARPLAGIVPSIQPVPAYPGSTLAMMRNRPEPTGPDGQTVLGLLAPGVYEVSLPTRKDVRPVQVPVAESGEALAQVTVP